MNLDSHKTESLFKNLSVKMSAQTLAFHNPSTITSSIPTRNYQAFDFLTSTFAATVDLRKKMSTDQISTSLSCDARKIAGSQHAECVTAKIKDIIDIDSLSLTETISETTGEVSSVSTQASLVTDVEVGENLEQKSLLNALNLESLSLLNADEISSKHHNKKPYVVGHRGCVYQELENTRAGFIKCADLGLDAAELDVFLLKCGTLIVFHGGGTDENPGDLLDYCGQPGNILDLTYEEALELEFNPEHEEFGCPSDITVKGRIPTLEEVLVDAKKTGLHIKVELKGDGTVEPSLEVVERLGMVDQCSFSSFDHSRIALLRQLRPDKTKYRTGALFHTWSEDMLEGAREAGATEIHLRYDTATPEAIQSIHEAGFGSMVWMRGPIGMKRDCDEKYWDVGNEDERMYDALLRTGVQQMCVNQPELLLRMCEKFANKCAHKA